MLTLPIFPLDLVVFPGEPVPLHIFEPRYRQLLADSAPRAGERQYNPFGILYSPEEAEPSKVGCTVIVDEILHKYPSGELDIMTYGQQRFRCLKMLSDSEHPYAEAEISWIEDLQPEGEAALRLEVLELYRAFLKIVEVEDLTLDERAEQLSFEIAYRVNMEKEPRLNLLMSRSEDERLDQVREYLEETVPQIQEAKEFRRRVRSNGYFA